MRCIRRLFSAFPCAALPLTRRLYRRSNILQVQEQLKPFSGWEELEIRKTQLETVINQLEKRIAQTQDRSRVTVSRSNGVFQYYIRAPKTASHKGKYVQSKNIKTVQKIVQKEYDRKTIKACKLQLKIIKKLLQEKNSIEKVYDKMPAGKQVLTTPATTPDNIYAKNWTAQPYTPKPFSPGDPEYYTTTGQRVRSKSEIIIATILEKLHIPYRYEYPLQIGTRTMHPDFYCLNTRTHKEFIWEHFGMMDNPDYAENFVQKMQTFNNNNYYLGKNLIVTFESKNLPLNPKMAERILKNYLA